MTPAGKHITPLRRLNDPYESWVFGPVGSKYTQTDRVSGPTPYIAALAEVGRNHPLLTVDAGKIKPPTGATKAHLATLWRPDLLQQGKAPSVFLPLLLETTDIAGWRADNAQPCHSVAADAVEIGVRLNRPVAEATVDTHFVGRKPKGDKPGARPKGKGGWSHAAVIMAVIDDGIPFAHRNFRNAKGRSRIDYCWLQSAPAAIGGAVLYGRELSGSDIENLVARYGGDEDALYRDAAVFEKAARYGRPVLRTGSHGAHIMDMAAGFHLEAPSGAQDASINPDRLRLITVQLPSPVTIDTAGVGKEAFVLSAFHYVFDRADAIAEELGTGPLPLVINFSYGFTGGPHDGTDRLESALNDLVEARRVHLDVPTELVMPAGNSFSSALHGEISETAAARGYDIPWRVQPNDHTANYLEIWPPPATDISKFSIRLTDPSGETRFDWKGRGATGKVDTAAFQAPVIDASGRAIGQISLDHFRGQRWRFLVILAPTEPDNPADDAVDCGLWKVGVKAVVNASIACRIQRDMDPVGYAHGARQSYFDDPCDVGFDETGRLSHKDTTHAFIRRFGSLNGLATHANVIVVGGFEGSSGQPTHFSSAGLAQLTPGQPGTVTCSAMVDNSSTSLGIRGAGTRSGSIFRLLGTSTAAPQVAWAIAREFLLDQSMVLEPALDRIIARCPKIPRVPAASARPERLGRAMLPFWDDNHALGGGGVTGLA